MRIVITTKSKNILMYWVTLQNNTIVGWISPFIARNLLGLPENVKIDVHFTYPSDGNLHFSIKLKNEHSESYETIFYNKRKVKIIEDGKTEIYEFPRKGNFYDEEFPIFAMEVPEEKRPPLEELRGHSFATSNFNVFKGEIGLLKHEKTMSESEIRKDDIVVDVSRLDKVNLAIYATVQGDPNAGRDKSTFRTYSKTIEMSKGRRLDLICNIYKHPSRTSKFLKKLRAFFRTSQFCLLIR